MNCIKVKRNNLLNSIYNSASLDFRFKETRYVNFFTDPELSSSLYMQEMHNFRSVISIENKSLYSSYRVQENVTLTYSINNLEI